MANFRAIVTAPSPRLLLSPPRTLLLVVLLTFSNAALAQVRTADPLRRGLQLSDFPRFVRLADNVYGYEEIRQPGFTTVSLVVIGRDGVLIADGQGNVQATQTMLDRITTLSPLPVRWYVVGLRDDGWYLARSRGSHQQYKHSTKPGRVTVPGSGNDDLARATLRSILKQAGLKTPRE